MKIGILTMHYRRNYGGILQSYAMMKILEELGHEVEVINFKYKSEPKQSYLNRITSLCNRLFKLSIRNKTVIEVRQLPPEHIKAFDDFKAKYMHYSLEVRNETIGNVSSLYDAIVVGSDQVWNNLSDTHLYYFFDWKPEFKGLKIAYAPCSIYQDVPQYNQSRLKDLLCKMDAISVRDETTAIMVKNVTNVKPQIVLDPTCLYDFNEFVKERIINGDYIFAYILGSEIACGHQEVIMQIKRKYGNMKVVAAIIPNVSLEVEKFADDIRYNASPSDWVNFVAHAKFVYTDSFHGCMFAMKFHKPFLAYYKDSRRVSRLKDIKETYSLDNIIQSGEDLKLYDLDYNKIDTVLKQKKDFSTAFLRHSLELVR